MNSLREQLQELAKNYSSIEEKSRPILDYIKLKAQDGYYSAISSVIKDRGQDQEIIDYLVQVCKLTVTTVNDNDLFITINISWEKILD